MATNSFCPGRYLPPAPPFYPSHTSRCRSYPYPIFPVPSASSSRCTGSSPSTSYSMGPTHSRSYSLGHSPSTNYPMGSSGSIYSMGPPDHNLNFPSNSIATVRRHSQSASENSQPSAKSRRAPMPVSSPAIPVPSSFDRVPPSVTPISRPTSLPFSSHMFCSSASSSPTPFSSHVLHSSSAPVTHSSRTFASHFRSDGPCYSIRDSISSQSPGASTECGRSSHASNVTHRRPNFLPLKNPSTPIYCLKSPGSPLSLHSCKSPLSQLSPHNRSPSSSMSPSTRSPTSYVSSNDRLPLSLSPTKRSTSLHNRPPSSTSCAVQSSRSAELFTNSRPAKYAHSGKPSSSSKRPDNEKNNLPSPHVFGYHPSALLGPNPSSPHSPPSLSLFSPSAPLSIFSSRSSPSSSTAANSRRKIFSPTSLPSLNFCNSSYSLSYEVPIVSAIVAKSCFNSRHELAYDNLALTPQLIMNSSPKLSTNLTRFCSDSFRTCCASDPTFVTSSCLASKVVYSKPRRSRSVTVVSNSSPNSCNNLDISARKIDSQNSVYSAEQHITCNNSSYHRPSSITESTPHVRRISLALHDSSVQKPIIDVNNSVPSQLYSNKSGVIRFAKSRPRIIGTQAFCNPVMPSPSQSSVLCHPCKLQDFQEKLATATSWINLENSPNFYKSSNYKVTFKKSSNLVFPDIRLERAVPVDVIPVKDTFIQNSRMIPNLPPIPSKGSEITVPAIDNYDNFFNGKPLPYLDFPNSSTRRKRFMRCNSETSASGLYYDQTQSKLNVSSKGGNTLLLKPIRVHQRGQLVKSYSLPVEREHNPRNCSIFHIEKVRESIKELQLLNKPNRRNPVQNNPLSRLAHRKPPCSVVAASLNERDYWTHTSVLPCNNIEYYVETAGCENYDTTNYLHENKRVQVSHCSVINHSWNSNKVLWRARQDSIYV